MMKVKDLKAALEDIDEELPLYMHVDLDSVFLPISGIYIGDDHAGGQMFVLSDGEMEEGPGLTVIQGGKPDE